MVTSLRVDTEVGQLYVEGQGSGPVVLLWPSLYCTSSMWCEQMPALATHYRVLTLDPPGHGRSGWPPPRFSLADTALATHRVLDAFEVPTAVIIGGASIFGGYGSIIGALAGAAVITLLRALLSLQIILADGTSMIMPQHWVNVFIGLILIVAVLGDIWLRQEGLLARLAHRLRRRKERPA